MVLHKKYFRNLSLSLLAFLFFVHANAQSEEDTVYRITDEMVNDTVIYQEENEIEYSPPIVQEVQKTYFIEKAYQGNGGGPPSIVFRTIKDSFVSSVRKDDAFWYVDYSFQKKQAQRRDEGRPFMQQPLAQTILWILIVCGFVAFLIIYLSSSDIGLFRKANRKISHDEDSDEISENIFEINYQREIDKAIQKKNYRLATRLMFLSLLKQLADKNIIKYQQDRTNFDYLMQLHGTKYYEDFFRLTRNYEYTWYGLFDVSDEKFQLIRADFEKMNSQVK